MTLPNFLIIGGGKSGSTALYRYLKQHPQIFMSSTKEPSFFVLEGRELTMRAPSGQLILMNSFGVNNLEDYRRLFDGVKTETAIGEASVTYLGDPKAAERIRHYIPNARLIALLRNPVEVAYSSFLMDLRNGVEPYSDFSDALRDQERRKMSECSGGSYIEPNFYCRHLKRYFDLFEREQIRIYWYEDFSTDPNSVVRDIFSFLDVEDTFVPGMTIRENVSGLPRNKILYKLLTGRSNPLVPYITPFLPHALRRVLIDIKNRNLVKTDLAPERRSELIEIFRADIIELQRLIDRDLSSWLE